MNSRKRKGESNVCVKSILTLQGCGYPPSVDCDVFTETYNNISDVCLHIICTLIALEINFTNYRWKLLSPATIQQEIHGLLLPDTTGKHKHHGALENLYVRH